MLGLAQMAFLAVVVLLTYRHTPDAAAPLLWLAVAWTEVPGRIRKYSYLLVTGCVIFRVLIQLCAVSSLLPQPMA